MVQTRTGDVKDFHENGGFVARRAKGVEKRSVPVPVGCVDLRAGRDKGFHNLKLPDPRHKH